MSSCPRALQTYAYAERFVRTIKEDCLEQMISFGEDSLRNAVREFIAHYHRERTHHGLGNRLISEVEGKTNPANRTSGGDQLYFRDPDNTNLQLSANGYQG